MQSDHCKQFVLTDSQRSQLEAIIRKRSSSQGLVLRARIILAAAEGLSLSASVRMLKCNRETVTLWRKHWITRQHLDKAVDRLKDAPRPGQKPKFTSEQVCQIIALACENPEDHGYPLSHWSQNALTKAAIEKGIVNSISQRQVGRFLKSGRYKA